MPVHAYTPERAMTLPGVPASIPWSKVADFLTGLGIDLSQVRRPSGSDADHLLPGIVIGWDSIQCDVKATNAKGTQYLDTHGRAATHRIHIPLIHDKPQP